MGGAASPRCARAAAGEGAGPHLHGRGREEGAADLAAGAIDPSWPPPLGSAEGEERRRRGREEDGAAAAGLTAEPCAAREEGGGERKRMRMAGGPGGKMVYLHLRSAENDYYNCYDVLQTKSSIHGVFETILNFVVCYTQKLHFHNVLHTNFPKKNRSQRLPSTSSGTNECCATVLPRGSHILSLARLC